MVLRIFIAFFIFILFTPLNALSIESIKYEGLVRISNLIANEIANIKVGDELSNKKINDAIIAFYKQDYFDDIYADFSDGVLTFHFQEKPGVSNVEINGYGNEQDTKDISQLINIKKGDTYDVYKEKYAKDVIITALQEKGIYNSVVEVVTTKLDDAISVVFNVNKGENIIINKSIYSGATIDSNELESLSANKQKHSWLWWLPWWPNGELKTKELEFDNLRVQDVYMRLGFLDAEVSPPLVNVDFTNYNATLMYKIKEGQKYKIANVDIRKNDDFENAFPLDELKDLLKLKPDEYFNIETLRRDVEILKSHIMDKGYAYAVVNPDLQKDEANAKANVTYVINIGKKVYINDVLITGNTNSADRIIRREMLLASGDLYSITDIRKSENALRRIGLFDNVVISEVRVDESSMNLLVEVTEGRTGEVMFGLGYGSRDKLMINGSLKERNLLGTGMNVQLYVNWSQYNQLYNVGLTNPRVLDSKYSLSLNAYKSYYDNYDYVEDSYGLNTSVGRNITDALSVNLAFDLVKTFLKDFKSVEAAMAYKKYFPPNGVLKLSLTPGLSFDNTDDYYFPKNGAIVQATSEFAELGKGKRFIKLFGKAGLYYHLKNVVDFDLIFRYKAQAGAIFDNGFLPINETFYMGGIGTVRGYESNSLSPLDNDGLRIGGKYVFANSFEVSYGIFESINMRLALFFDFGMLGKNNITEIMRMSWGGAIEWVSPIGPLVFVFPVAINPKLGDRTSNFEFTMGTRF